jgi:hypothetical protein
LKEVDATGGEPRVPEIGTAEVPACAVCDRHARDSSKRHSVEVFVADTADQRANTSAAPPLRRDSIIFMPSRRSSFRQSDVTRALRGAEKGGMRVERVEIGPDGKIMMFSGSSASSCTPSNPWDEELGR